MVWTDTIQITLMYGSIIAIAIKGVIDVGGLGAIYERNLNSSRFELLKYIASLVFELI